MKTLIRELSFSAIEHGWGNGYVLIPPGHPFHGKSYNEIHDMAEINVNGGLTFSELVDEDMLKHWNDLDEEYLGFWMVGFDTAHYGDTLERWPEESVQAETDRLAKQIESYTI